MAWAYCEHCGAPVDQPTARQILKEEVYCFHGCGKPQTVRNDTRNDAIDELIDRLERLEKLQ